MYADCCWLQVSIFTITSHNSFRSRTCRAMLGSGANEKNKLVNNRFNMSRIAKPEYQVQRHSAQQCNRRSIPSPQSLISMPSTRCRSVKRFERISIWVDKERGVAPSLSKQHWCAGADDVKCDCWKGHPESEVWSSILPPSSIIIHHFELLSSRWNLMCDSMPYGAWGYSSKMCVTQNWDTIGKIRTILLVVNVEQKHVWANKLNTSLSKYKVWGIWT